MNSGKVPDWVPSSVERVARRLGAAFHDDGRGEFIPLLRRLIFDARMRNVWAELNKRRRENYVSTGQPFHPSMLPQAIESWKKFGSDLQKRAAEYRELGGDLFATELEQQAAIAEARDQREPAREITAAQRHDIALAVVFASAVANYILGLETITQNELNAHVGALRAAGKKGIADAFERQAADQQAARLIVKPRRTDPRLEAFVEAVAREMTAVAAENLIRTGLGPSIG